MHCQEDKPMKKNEKKVKCTQEEEKNSNKLKKKKNNCLISENKLIEVATE